MIRYTDETDCLDHEQLAGFFVDWPSHPDTKTHLQILRNSFKVWLALDGDRCVGFINAISDGVFYSHIPLLEVLPEYRGQGIGSTLVRKMIESLDGMYAIDVVCDESVDCFYRRNGFGTCVGMVRRNYENQGAKRIAEVGA